VFRRRTAAAEVPVPVGERLDVQAAGADEALTATVLEADASTVAVTVGRTASGRGVRLEPGTRLTLTWTDDTALLALPARLLGASFAGEPRWDLRITGPVRRIQRRSGVRVAVRLPVTVNAGGPARTGTTVDLGETGGRLVLDRPPTDEAGEPVRSAGDRMLFTLQLDGRTVTSEAELVRRHRRLDGRWEASVEFTRLTAGQRETLRREVVAGGTTPAR
jgi:hypothetical protein